MLKELYFYHKVTQSCGYKCSSLILQNTIDAPLAIVTLININLNQKEKLFFHTLPLTKTSPVQLMPHLVLKGHIHSQVCV